MNVGRGKIGWALFALVLIGLIGYGLNRGVYVGSEVFSDMDGRFRKQCKYLFPGGVTRKISGVWITRAEAQDEFCHLFHD
jgi:hypothetical protein